MAIIKTLFNNLSIDENDYRVKKVLENLKKRNIYATLKEDRESFSSLINSPVETVEDSDSSVHSHNLIGELKLEKDKIYYCFDSEGNETELTYISDYFKSDSDLDINNTLITYKHQKYYVEGTQLLPLLNDISFLSDKFITLNGESNGIISYTDSNFSVNNKLFTYNSAFASPLGIFNLCKATSNCTLEYNEIQYNFINDNISSPSDEDEIIISGYFLESAYIDAYNDEKNVLDIADHVITYVSNSENPEESGWALYFPDGSAESSFEYLFEDITVNLNGIKYKLFNIESGNSAKIPEGPTFLTETEIKLGEAETKIYYQQSDELKCVKVKKFGSDILYLDDSSSKKDLSELEKDYFIYDDIKYIRSDGNFYRYYFLSDIPSLYLINNEDSNEYIYNKQHNQYFLKNIDSILENITGLMREISNDDGQFSTESMMKRNFGNFYTFLKTNENKTIYGESIDKKIFNRILGEYLIYPKIGFSSRTNIFKSDNPVFTAINEIDEGYDKLSEFMYDSINRDYKKFETYGFKSIKSFLIGPPILEAHGFSENRSVLGSDMWLSLTKDKPLIFYDYRDKLVLHSLNGKYEYFTEKDNERFLKILAANIVDIIEEKHKGYLQSLKEDLLNLSDDLKTGMSDFKSMFDNIFENINFSNKITTITGIVDTMHNLISNMLDNTEINYDSLSDGYCVYDTYLRIIEKIKNNEIELKTIEDMEFYEGCYLLSRFFKEDQNVTVLKFEATSDSINGLRPITARIIGENMEVMVNLGESKILFRDTEANIGTKDENSFTFKKLFSKKLLDEDFDGTETDDDFNVNVNSESLTIGSIIESKLSPLYSDMRKFRNCYSQIIANLNNPNNISATQKFEFLKEYTI